MYVKPVLQTLQLHKTYLWILYNMQFFPHFACVQKISHSITKNLDKWYCYFESSARGLLK
jgi:hypothetical protein